MIYARVITKGGKRESRREDSPANYLTVIRSDFELTNEPTNVESVERAEFASEKEESV